MVQLTSVEKVHYQIQFGLGLEGVPQTTRHVRPRGVPDQEGMGEVLHDSSFRERVLVLFPSTHESFPAVRLHDLILVHYLHGVNLARLLHAHLRIGRLNAKVPRTPFRRTPFRLS